MTCFHWPSFTIDVYLIKSNHAAELLHETLNLYFDGTDMNWLILKLQFYHSIVVLKSLNIMFSRKKLIGLSLNTGVNKYCKLVKTGSKSSRLLVKRISFYANKMYLLVSKLFWGSVH